MTGPSNLSDTHEPSPSEVLAVVLEDHFITLLGLSGEQRDRLRDAGAGVILQKFETRLADTAGGLGGLVGQQAAQVEELREKLFGWISELNADDSSSSGSGSEDTDGRGSGYGHGDAGSDPPITTETGEAT